MIAAGLNLTLTVCIALADPTADAPNAPELTFEKSGPHDGAFLSETGYFELEWHYQTDGDDSPGFTLQEAPTPAFAKPKTIYQGGDASTSISGRRNGEYHYRVRAGDGQWSDAVTVIVQHRSLTQALIFLALGAVVFLATVILIIAGHVTHRRNGVSA